MSLKGKLNPVFLREVRRFVRNRAVQVPLGLFLAVLLVMGASTFLISTKDYEVDAGFCYTWFIRIFGSVAVLVIPVAVFCRQAVCVRTVGPELMSSAGHSPVQLVDGMALTGISGMLLTLFVTFPMLMLTSRISSVSLATSLNLSSRIAALSMAAVYYAVACGSSRISGVMRVIAFVTGMSALMYGANFYVATLMWHIPYYITDAEIALAFWTGFVVTVLGSRLIAVGVLSPPDSNRYAPLHRMVLICWSLSLLLFVVGSHVSSFRCFCWTTSGGWCVWFAFWGLMMNLLMLFSACTPSFPSPDFQKPRKKIFLLTRIFLESGAEHGMALSLLLLSVSALLGFMGSKSSENGSQLLILIFMYVTFGGVLSTSLARMHWRERQVTRVSHPWGSVLCRSLVGYILVSGLSVFMVVLPFVSMLLFLTICIIVPLSAISSFIGLYSEGCCPHSNVPNTNKPNP